jgi:DNA adenine methylase
VINNYHELFLGGGSVLFALLTKQKEKTTLIRGKIYAYDINEKLIQVYKDIQTNKDGVFDHLSILKNEYDSIVDIPNMSTNMDPAEVKFEKRNPKTIEDAKLYKESYYYWCRKKFNESSTNSAQLSALFIFLNKTCFRGLYRISRNGYNVPYGHPNNTPNCISKEEIDAISFLIKDVEFIACDFSQALLKSQPDDFYYSDSPYYKVSKNSFDTYDLNGFADTKHVELFDKLKKIGEEGAYFSMSNANFEFVLNHFPNYQCEIFDARRAIHSKQPGSTASELIIYNT